MDFIYWQHRFKSTVEIKAHRSWAIYKRAVFQHHHLFYDFFEYNIYTTYPMTAVSVKVSVSKITNLVVILNYLIGQLLQPYFHLLHPRWDKYYYVQARALLNLIKPEHPSYD